ARRGGALSRPGVPRRSAQRQGRARQGHRGAPARRPRDAGLPSARGELPRRRAERGRRGRNGRGLEGQLMATFTPDLLAEVRGGLDMVELVGRFVTLRKAGANGKGLCPFHAEKTPSFTVNPAKGIFHCFGCGVGGDAFGFLMRQDRLTFPEAVRALARTAGVALPDERGQGGDSGRDELLAALRLAARFYQAELARPAGERARAYLEQRGIDPEVAKTFGLGYAPEGWDTLLGYMRSEKIAEDTLITAGLAVRRDNRAGAYDRFRG